MLYSTKRNLVYFFILVFVFISMMQDIKSEEYPADMPIPIITKINNPSSGGIYMSPFGEVATPQGPYGNYLMILDSAGKPVKFKLLPGHANGYKGYHFKSEMNGLLSFMNRKESQELDGTVFVTDTAFNVLHAYKDTVNPYTRVKYYGAHHIMPNGNTLLLKYDFRYVDMSKYFPNGEPNGATLQGFIQEIDKDHNVVFQWQSLDYIPISDTYNPVTPAIEYFHGNSIAYDYDGNFLVSARNLCAIIKVNRNTGDIIWTLGGRSNDFKFIGENEANAPTYFSYQHDIRLLNNGNITLFDNGRQHNPPYSRVVEYEIDEKNMTCKMVYEHRNTPDIYADIFGSYQKLPNGNHFIAWGNSAVNGGISLQEISTDGNIELEVKLPEKLVSQFIYKSPWPVCPTIGDVTKYEMLELNTYDFNKDDNRTGVKITWNTLNAFIYNQLNIKKYDCAPMNPQFNGKAPNVLPFRLVLDPKDISEVDGLLSLDLNDFMKTGNPEELIIYYRNKEGEGIFEPLETEYDVETNRINTVIKSAEGEFVIGKPNISVIPQAPLLYTPVDNFSPNIQQKIIFNWNPRGYFTQSQIQISDDKEFTNIVIDTTTKLIKYQYPNPILNKTQYWRVRSGNDAGLGNWSEVRTFMPSEPFIKINYPNGGEKWDTLNYIIRWDYNVLDSINSIFKIELFRNGEFSRLIKDNLFTVTNSFKWKVPADIEDDTTYQIKITAIKNVTLNTISSKNFTIKKSISNVEENEHTISELKIQSYPNPTGEIAQFEFNTPMDDNIEISLYDNDGNLINKIYDGFIRAGNHKIEFNTVGLSQGIYIYRIRSSEHVSSGKLILSK